ncbi:MAG: aldo/keto reductase, partial [Gammaproteobacteria bacterium]|nr:aldo/keto reductase [Gammaproteobacteria bacterium]
MELRSLGATDLKVSRLCLGTMTWGRQNTPGEAFEQLDAAVEAGVNFIDTAEIYPVPPDAETGGATETILGQWLAGSGRRQDLIIATKVAGPGMPAMHIRDGVTRFDTATVSAALDASLARMGTDYVDLLYLHWPARACNFFGQLGYKPAREERDFDLAESAAALRAVVASGRARAIGLSNETPWGMMTLIRELGDVPVAALQNPYSLLNRSFEVGLAEICHRENIAMCGYSPLGFGVLAGKYLDGAMPEGSRLKLFPHYRRYSTPVAEQAVRQY